METVTLREVMSLFGPSGIAAVAVWWLTRVHDAQVRAIVDGHHQGLEAIAAQLKAIDERNEVREEKKVEVMEKMRDAISDCTRRLDGVERELEGAVVKPKPKP